jgi:hypothetical protein
LAMRAEQAGAAATEAQEEEKEEPQRGHQAPKNSAASQEATDPEILAYREHQATAARISLPEEARTLVAGGSFGVLATQARGDLAGFPSGSVVEFAADEQVASCSCTCGACKRCQCCYHHTVGTYFLAPSLFLWMALQPTCFIAGGGCSNLCAAPLGACWGFEVCERLRRNSRRLSLQGRPIFAFSTMSPHTADIKKEPRCSFTVMADPFKVSVLAVTALSTLCCACSLARSCSSLLTHRSLAATVNRGL